MKSFEFKSLKDTMMYRISPKFNYWGTNSVSNNVSMFDTLGDGTTQHTPLTYVPPERFDDFIFSLVEFIFDISSLEEREKCVSIIEDCCFIEYSNFDAIEFAHKIKYKENVTQYYSLTFLKISKSEKKKYDSRWKEVPKWADGCPESIFGILHENCYNIIFKMIYYDSILNTAKRLDGVYHGSEVDYVLDRIFEDSSYRMIIGQAFSCIHNLVKANRKIFFADRLFNAYKHNIENRNKKE
jgi:hypothetical protein